MSARTYDSRAQTHPTAVGCTLLSAIAVKKTNFCISLDLTDADAILSLLDCITPSPTPFLPTNTRSPRPLICCAKTHINILPFSGPDAITTFTSRLVATTHNFLIFEDRKFADIGSTVKSQYSGGIYNIASWEYITNVHSVPGWVYSRG